LLLLASYVYVALVVLFWFHECWNSSVLRFFYKYNLLTNVFIKTNPLPMFLTNLAWREAEKVPRRTFRHCTWRCYYPAKGIGGKAFPPLATAEVNSGGLALSACMQATRRKHMPRVHAWPLTHARAA
jgi:hypothetical protein